MKRLILVLGTAVVLFPWLAGGTVQADAIHWTASGTPLGPNLDTHGYASIEPQNGVDAGILLTPGNPTSGTNSGSVVVIALGVYQNPSGFGIPTFGGPSANYSVSLALHDAPSGASGSLTFRGNLSGFIDTGDYGHLTNTILGPATQTLTLGRDVYTVTIGPFVTPGDSYGQSGSLSASIDVQPVTNSTPEPSSLLLACLGLPSLGLARWVRHRRRKNADCDAHKA